MNKGARTLGNHGFFFRDGTAYTVPTPGTAGRASKPDAADAAWIDLGIVASAKPEHGREEQDVFAPTPGQKRLYDVIETQRQLTWTLTLEEMSPLVFELLFGTAALTSSSTQYNPLEGTTKKGWLKVQQYDQADALFNTMDVFCVISVANAEFGDGIVRVELKARVLHSTLNTGTLP